MKDNNTPPEPVLIVVNNHYERRYFFSAAQAARGLGWFNWKANGRHPDLVPQGRVEVYRIDEEATAVLNAQLAAAPRDHNPQTGKWLPHAQKQFVSIFRTVTGIKK